MYQFILLHTCDYLWAIASEANVVIDEGNSRNKTRTLNKEMKLE